MSEPRPPDQHDHFPTESGAQPDLKSLRPTGAVSVLLRILWVVIAFPAAGSAGFLLFQQGYQAIPVVIVSYLLLVAAAMWCGSFGYIKNPILRYLLITAVLIGIMVGAVVLVGFLLLALVAVVCSR